MDHINNQISHELQNTNPTSSWNNLENMGMEPHHLLHLHHNIPITPPIWPPWSAATPAIAAAQDRQLIISVNNDEQILTEDQEELGAMKEMMYKIAAMQPVDIDPATLRRPKRRNVRISDDPQSVAARHRRERISEKIRILQRLVPGGTKMDTASMLEEAIRYVKFLKAQIRHLQSYRRPPSPSTCIISGSPSTAVASSSHSHHHSLTSFNHEVIRD